MEILKNLKYKEAVKCVLKVLEFQALWGELCLLLCFMARGFSEKYASSTLIVCGIKKKKTNKKAVV
jgi:hypothetical protein